MHHTVTVVLVVDLLVCLYVLALCAAAGRAPKPPKAPLTPEQKVAQKAMRKLNRIASYLPNNGNGATHSPNGKVEYVWTGYDAYLAWDTVVNLSWQIRTEAKI
jgi:hypothetical protein